MPTFGKKLSIDTISRVNTIWTANTMIDNIPNFCINSSMIYSSQQPSSMSSWRHLPLWGTGIEIVSITTPSKLSSTVSLGLSAPLWLFCADKERWFKGGPEVTAVSGWERETLYVAVLERGEGEEPRERGVWSNGDRELWGWNGGVPPVGVAVPITWEMHSSILHFKAWKKKITTHNKQNSQ